MKRFLILVMVALLMAASITACSSAASPAETEEVTQEPGDQTPETVSHGGPVEDYVSLVDALRAGGASVEPVEEINQEFFSVPGQIIRVNGEDVQVFEYENEDAAQQEAATIVPDGGSIGTSMVTWVATPHFYQKARLIVLYVGENADVKAALEAALGSQIAGGK